MSLFSVKDVDQLLVAILDISSLAVLSQTNRYYRRLVQANRDYLTAYRICLKESTWGDRFKLAAQAGQTKIIDWIRQKSSLVQDKYHHACRSGNLDLVQRLYSETANFNLSKGFLLACQSNCLALVQWLYGLDVSNQLNKKRGFEEACQCDALETAQWLAHICERDLTQTSAVLVAQCIRSDSLNITQWLTRFIRRDRPSKFYLQVFTYLSQTEPMNQTEAWMYASEKLTYSPQRYVRYCLKHNLVSALTEYIHTYRYTPTAYDQALFQKGSRPLVMLYWQFYPAFFRKTLELMIVEARLDGTIGEKAWLVDLFHA